VQRTVSGRRELESGPARASDEVERLEAGEEMSDGPADRVDVWRNACGMPSLLNDCRVDHGLEGAVLDPLAGEHQRGGQFADRGLERVSGQQRSRALVRDAVELRPDWWDTALFGPPNREDEIVPLVRLHDLLRDLRLLRRSGRRIVATKRGRTLLADPAALLDECATALLAGDTCEAAVGELAAALMLAGERMEYGVLERAIHPAIVEQGWQSATGPPSVHAVGGAIGHLLAGLEALDLVTGTRRTGLALTPAGRYALHVGLRARATGPKNRFRAGSTIRVDGHKLVPAGPIEGGAARRPRCCRRLSRG
jgi:hypothetical protein